jgi:uncharacterized membrane protein YqjE
MPSVTVRPHTVAEQRRPVRAVRRGLPGGARRLAVRAAAASRTTPVLLRIWLVVVATLLVLTGAAGVVSAVDQEAAATEIVERIEPLSADAAAVYRALADADATLVSGYLQPDGPSPQDRQRYEDDIAAAAAGLAAAAGRADDPATADRIAYLGRQLPVYTGLVERARAADRQGLPAGPAHLAEASELMESSMLPVAESLQQRKARALSAAFDRTQSVPVAALVLAVVTLSCLVVLQIVVARRFRRVLNAGLLAATVLLVLGLGWWTVAGSGAGTSLGAAREHGRAVNEALVPAQIAALQARTTEGASLLGRATSDQAFEDRLQRLARNGGAGGALGASARLATSPDARVRIGEAVAAAADYRAAHQQVHRAAAEGRFADATQLALAEGAPGTSAAFDRLDAALVAAVGAERRAFAERMAAAAAWRWALPAGSVVCTLLVVGAAARGVGGRLREYRDPLRATGRHHSPGGSP